MQSITKLAAASALAGILAGPVIRAQDAEEKKKPVPMALALKLGPEELTQYTDPSEAGQDNAALLYANAKSNKEAMAQLAAEAKQVTEHWDTLKHQIEEIPGDQARKIAAFAVESLGWLKEGGEKQAGSACVIG